MVVLKKIKASTLMETLVATVLIVIVFMMASMTLNSLFANTVASNTNEVTQELLFLQYQYENGQLELPYFDELGNWEIKVEEQEWKSNGKINFSAEHLSIKKEVTFSLVK
ncbi:hypothetical protein [Allomuricauda sp. M10]|uniref:hypothetical protein n=1 Tax=Allomuricauda sp. M10 TaxID=2683292 RepID=UPI001D188736|nr:hypothetical protein [Muricauda sp. M10]